MCPGSATSIHIFAVPGGVHSSTHGARDCLLIVRGTVDPGWKRRSTHRNCLFVMPGSQHCPDEFTHDARLRLLVIPRTPIHSAMRLTLSVPGEVHSRCQAALNHSSRLACACQVHPSNTGSAHGELTVNAPWQLTRTDVRSDNEHATKKGCVPGVAGGSAPLAGGSPRQ